jgi:hypothetical protein
MSLPVATLSRRMRGSSTYCGLQGFTRRGQASARISPGQ